MTTSAGPSEHSPGPDAARLLVDAVHEWARERFGAADTAHIATGATECTRCPICQLIAALRGDRPEVTEKLTTAAATLLDVLGAVLGPPPERTSDPTTNPAGTEPPSDPIGKQPAGAIPSPPGIGPPRRSTSNRRRPTSPRVQHIDLDDVAPRDEHH